MTLALSRCLACGFTLMVERTVVKFPSPANVPDMVYPAAQILHGDPECADWKDPLTRQDCIPKNITSAGIGAMTTRELIAIFFGVVGAVFVMLFVTQCATKQQELNNALQIESMRRCQPIVEDHL